MSFNFVKRMLLALMLLMVSFCGVWLVVTNPQQLHLNLLFVEIPTINSGLVILLTFVLGCVVGLLAAVVIFKVLPLRWQLRQSHQQIAELRKQNAKPPLSL